MEPLELSWGDYDAIVAEGRTHVLLDVREGYEWERGHVATALHLPRREVAERAGELFPDPSVFIITCCQAGGRAAGAARELAAKGYHNLAYLVGDPGTHYASD